jgi:anti-anti-sigma factor
MIGLTVEHHDGVPVGTLPLDVDSANARRLRDELEAAVGNDTFDLVLDLTATQYLDSAGIDMLFRLGQRLSQRRAHLRLVIPPTSQLLRLAEVVGLVPTLPRYDTLAAALADTEPAGEPNGLSASADARSPSAIDERTQRPR